MLGLKRGTLVLAPYSDDWPRLFEAEKQLIQRAVGPYILDVQHIGSTSIPGLVAKPIIDTMVGIASFEAATVCIKPLEQAGYEYRGENGIPRRHYFVRGTPTTHHTHMFEIDTEDWSRHIRFRDKLRADPALAAEYARLKRQLWETHRDNRQAYQDGKTGFIARVQRQP